MSDLNLSVLVSGVTSETGKFVVKSLQAKHIPVHAFCIIPQGGMMRGV